MTLSVLFLHIQGRHHSHHQINDSISNDSIKKYDTIIYSDINNQINRILSKYDSIGLKLDSLNKKLNELKKK